MFFLLGVVAFPLTAFDFFDDPVLLEYRRILFPQVGSLKGELVVLYQEVVASEEDDGGVIYLRGMSSEEGKQWNSSVRLTGAIPYSGDNPPEIFSARFSSDEILLAVAESDETIGIYRIPSANFEMENIQKISTQGEFVAPRLFGNAEQGFYLFASKHQDFRIDIYLATSNNGRRWGSFEQFSVDENTSLNFNPTYIRSGLNDIVVYQALDPTVAGAYQLYLRHSEAGKDNWSSPILLTDFSAGGNPSRSFDNQRPELSIFDGDIYVTWERRFSTQTRHVFTGKLAADFSFATIPEQVSTGFNNINNPHALEINGQQYIVWSQSRSDGDRIILARRNGFLWEERNMSRGLNGSAGFPSVVFHRGRMHVFWQNRVQDQTGLAHLAPDLNVDRPLLSAIDFPADGRSRSSLIEVGIELPEDPSGIAGYSYVWTRDSRPVVPDTDQPMVADTLRLTADEDGRWFLHVKVQDVAGNWSEPASISYYRDTIPPDVVRFEEPNIDDEGFLQSNSFTVRWLPPDDNYIAGYTYSYQRLATDVEQRYQIQASLEEGDLSLVQFPAAIRTRDTEFTRSNEDNGVWLLTVAAIDDVGNIGPETRLLLSLNKYIPVTIVRILNAEADAVGRLSVSIIGRGFRADGLVEEIQFVNIETGEVVYRFQESAGDYQIPSDRRIDELKIARPIPGSYQVLLRHASRGVYRISRVLDIQAAGTVKFGNYELVYQAQWARSSEKPPVIIFSYSSLWLYVVLALLLIIAVASAWQLVRLAGESKVIRQQAQALLKGELMQLEKPVQAIMEKAGAGGIGLRAKFTAFATVLVASVVLMVSLTLGSFVLDTQTRTLVRGLQERVEVLLDSIVTASSGFLPAPEGNVPELNALTQQISVMPEALHATITGRGRTDVENFDYIWASSNPEINENLQRGITRLDDELAEEAKRLESRINTEAQQELGDVAQRIDDFTADIIRLALDASTTAEAERREIDAVRSELETRLNSRLNEIAGGAKSYPEFDTEKLSSDQTEYIFYQPVVYRNPNQNVYYRGMVRMGISTDLIRQEIATSQRRLIITTVVIALIAVGLGIGGALLLASIIIIPINTLVRGVETIRLTEDKKDLKNHVIEVKSRDELHILADSVNLMTQGLVKAAEASEELTIGKEVQKMFIPLTRKDGKTKLSTGKEESDTYEFFGYYEGAKTVSGDYFSYIQLDPTTFALVKCDVAGKGVSAALIMVEVATLFLHHFRGWNDPTLSGKALMKQRQQIRDLNALLVSINDLLESTALAGRFAALTIGILDIDSHRLTLANAGDNQVHMYRAGEASTRQYAMASSPAAGVFSSDMNPNGYKSSVFQLEIGDIVLFFTDGLEEAKRLLRDSDYQQKFTAENVGDEEFSIARIHRITETIQARGIYRLERQDNPVPEEQLIFDFSSIEPTAENTVLGLICIEKIMRCYRDPSAGQDDKVVIDRFVDDFLQKVFGAYNEYFFHPVEGTQDKDYRQYAFIKEDDQYDDLTLLAIRRKK